jgi:hypothetical protein
MRDVSMPLSAALSLRDLDLDVRVRSIAGREECMTSDCNNPARLLVTVTERRSKKHKIFRACPECRSTALLEILEGR